jgi:protein-S-isoprenylcysteine O-methyltransferase Ste14
LLVGWRVHWSWTPSQIGAVATICLGLVPLVWALVEFARAGGTPSPTASPDHLVVDGFNRYVRNPIYVGVLLTIMGQVLRFNSLLLVAHAVLAGTKNPL